MTDVTLFVGPSGHGVPRQALARGKVRLRPPVGRGDVDRLVQRSKHPGTIVICDGVFPEQSAGSDSMPAATTTRPIAVAPPRAVILAPMPAQPIPKSNASARLLATIAAIDWR